MLIQASRTRSSVGRTRSPFGALIRRPRHLPETIRIFRFGKLEAGSGKRVAGSAPLSCPLTHPDASYPCLQVALPSVLVPLQPEGDVHLASWLELGGARAKTPPDRLE